MYLNCKDFSMLTGLPPNKPTSQKVNSPKGNKLSAIPFALLCMIVNWSERNQGSGPKGDKVL